MNNMRRQILAITLLCILSITGFAVLLTVPTKAATSDATVLSSSWYIAPVGGNAYSDNDLVAVGEVQNVGTANIQYMYVKAYAYDNDSNMLAESPSTQIFANNLEPEQKAPFYIDFADLQLTATGDNTYTANVTSVVVVPYYVKNSDDKMYLDLTVTSESSTTGGYSVIGSVKNTGSQIANQVRVITTFYNSSGKVVSINYTEVLSDSLNPGSSVSFAAKPVDGYSGASGAIASYASMVQTKANVPTTTATPTAQPTATPNPTTSTSTSPTPTASITQNNQDYTLIIVGIVVVIVAALAAVLLLRRNRGSSAPSSTSENSMQ
jgi:hypothetical protein